MLVVEPTISASARSAASLEIHSTGHNYKVVLTGILIPQRWRSPSPTRAPFAGPRHADTIIQSSKPAQIMSESYGYLTTRSYDLSTQLFRHQQGFCWTRAPLVHQASPGDSKTRTTRPTNRATRGTSSLPPGPSPSGRLCHCAALSSADAVYPTSTTSPRSARRLTDIVAVR